MSAEYFFLSSISFPLRNIANTRTKLLFGFDVSNYHWVCVCLFLCATNWSKRAGGENWLNTMFRCRMAYGMQYDRRTFDRSVVWHTIFCSFDRFSIANTQTHGFTQHEERLFPMDELRWEKLHWKSVILTHRIWRMTFRSESCELCVVTEKYSCFRISWWTTRKKVFSSSCFSQHSSPCESQR